MAVKNIEYKGKLFDVHYEIINHNCINDVIILHGWGSNKEVMKSAFKDYLKEFRHIYIDLVGFGKSTQDIVGNSHDFAKIVELLLSRIQASKNIIIGHSFGGKIATLLKPKLLVLLSSAGILEKKSLSVKGKIAIAKLLKPLRVRAKFLIAKDAKDLSPNMYITFKQVVNEDFSDIFKNFSNNCLIFWGKDDEAVNVSSAEQIHSFIKNSYLKIYDGDHYFFLYNSKDICDNIIKGTSKK